MHRISQSEINCRMLPPTRLLDFRKVKSMKNTFIALCSLILLAVSLAACSAECPLCDAAEDGNLSEVKRLLDEGANVNDKNEDGLMAFNLAKELGHGKVAKVLLSNNKDENGKTILMEAVRRGKSEVVKELLNNGANVNVADQYGWTALMVAASGKSEIVKLLLDHEANVNDKNKNGLTALMAAASNLNIKVTKILLENDANINDKNKDGLTALMLAINQRHYEEEIYEIIKTKEFKKYHYSRAVKVVKLLLECGANPDIRNNKGRNTLDYVNHEAEMSAIFDEHLISVLQGHEFPSCHKTAAN